MVEENSVKLHLATVFGCNGSVRECFSHRC